MDDGGVKGGGGGRRGEMKYGASRSLPPFSAREASPLRLSSRAATALSTPPDMAHTTCRRAAPIMVWLRCLKGRPRFLSRP